MAFCLFCDAKLYSEGTQVCSSTTPHSNVPYPEVIDKLVGDICPIIVKPTDQLCMYCTSLMTRMDKLECVINQIKNKFVSYSQNKHGKLPTIQAVNSFEKKRLWICQVCSKTFDSPINCLDHIAKDHNLPTPSNSNGEKETEDSHQVTTKVMKPEPSMTKNDNVFTRGSADVTKKEEIDQETSDSVKEEVYVDSAYVENKTGDLA